MLTEQKTPEQSSWGIIRSLATDPAVIAAMGHIVQILLLLEIISLLQK